MYINDDRSPKTVKFATLCEGDTFYDENENVYCMVIEPCQVEHSSEAYRAVDIRNGSLYFYSDDEDVEPVIAHVSLTST